MFSIIQWFVFLLANAVAIPIVIGPLFDMSSIEVMQLMQRTFFIMGVACFLQGWIGHKMPIVDGPAGIWVSTFAVFAGTISTATGSAENSLRLLEMAMILTGIFLMLFGLFKISGKIISIFTPLVTGVFLTLLTVQLGGTFLQGMTGVAEYAVIQIDATIVSFITFILVLVLSLFSHGWKKSYAVLIGIVVGWVVYELFIGTSSERPNGLQTISAPEWFAWGTPIWDWSLIPIALLTAVILLSNIVAALSAVTDVREEKARVSYGDMNRSSFTLGVNHGISGIFSGIAVITLASSAGFLKLTGEKRIRPFLIASAVLILASFFPSMIYYLAQIPAPIANAALLATFVELMGLGIKNLFSNRLDDRNTTIITVSLLIGSGLMFFPADSFSGLSDMVRQVVSNGLLVGTAIAVILELIWKRPEQPAEINEA
ncbi:MULTISPECIES: purine/pyrimidine permease [Allobacillus]|uniref:Purine/pyrimidine permease n=1 Tax=Allobacillus halotolerans TaxID=570278 RepID=A0ABS6GNS6_9BACI|nr:MULTISPECIES: purine/pyrimidine permease [Allobacillus]MBU6080092.1 purine/pyrimidine permease [Allobacillus halotolerans]TSJ65455.1 uracil permease [Allobacillus sp. SKP2-8]